VPNINPVPGEISTGRHTVFGLTDGIFAHVPGAKSALDTWMGTVRAATTLSPRLIELIRIRVAFHNQCRMCMATRYLPDQVDEALVCSLERPAEATDLTVAERAALRFADLFANDHLAIDAGVYDSLRVHFVESELVELGLFCAYFVGIGRLSATWGVVEDLPRDFGLDERGVVTPWGHDEVLPIESAITA
jgi:alkylhydroperoxidase family enzyme